MRRVPTGRHVRPFLTLAALVSAGWAAASAESRPYLAAIGPSILRYDMTTRATIAMSLPKPAAADSPARSANHAEAHSKRAKQAHPALGEASSPVLPTASANLLPLIEDPLFSGSDTLYSPDYSPLQPGTRRSTAALGDPEGAEENRPVPNVIPAQEKSGPAVPTRAFIRFFEQQPKSSASTNRAGSDIKVAVPFYFEPPSATETPSSSAEFKKE